MENEMGTVYLILTLLGKEYYLKIGQTRKPLVSYLNGKHSFYCLVESKKVPVSCLEKVENTILETVKREHTATKSEYFSCNALYHALPALRSFDYNVEKNEEKKIEKSRSKKIDDFIMSYPKGTELTYPEVRNNIRKHFGGFKEENEVRTISKRLSVICGPPVCKKRGLNIYIAPGKKNE